MHVIQASPHNMTNHISAADLPFISKEDKGIFEIVNCVCLSSSLCLFGVVANIINMAVFCKQGFKNTMNISFFGLAISDLFSLIHLQWIVIFMNPWIGGIDVPMVPTEIQYLSGSVPHICFVRVTNWITVYITAERFMCITFPLQIKQIITPRRTALIITLIFVFVVSSFFLEYASCYYDWKFSAERNSTVLGLVFRSNRKSMDGVMYAMYSLTGGVSFLAVIVFTLLLVVQLKRKSKWRQKANLDKAMAVTMTVRDRKTMSMVAVIASVLIVCYCPGVVGSVFTVIEPELSIVGKQVNTFIVIWSFNFLMEAINSSINIVIYYNMGTKYRTTFNHFFGVHKQHPGLQSRDSSGVW